MTRASETIGRDGVPSTGRILSTIVAAGSGAG